MVPYPFDLLFRMGMLRASWLGAPCDVLVSGLSELCTCVLFWPGVTLKFVSGLAGLSACIITGNLAETLVENMLRLFCFIAHMFFGSVCKGA